MRAKNKDILKQKNVFLFYIFLQTVNVMKEDLWVNLVMTILVPVHANLTLLVPNVNNVMRDIMDGHGQIVNVIIFSLIYFQHRI